jgi:hypothetical protein
MPASFVFCNFNKHLKFSPSVFRAWLEILQAVDDSILCLLENPADSIKYLMHFIESFDKNLLSRVRFQGKQCMAVTPCIFDYECVCLYWVYQVFLQAPLTIKSEHKTCVTLFLIPLCTMDIQLLLTRCGAGTICDDVASHYQYLSI